MVLIIEMNDSRIRFSEDERGRLCIHLPKKEYKETVNEYGKDNVLNQFEAVTANI